MTLPLLYSFRRCPYAIRARLALKAAGVQVRLREVALRSKPDELLATSLKGTVPVLVLGSGEVIAESLEIMRWALEQNDPLGLLRDSPAQDELLALNDGPFKQLLDRYKYSERFPEKSQSEWRDEAVALQIAPLESRLQASSFLLGEQPALVDLALMPFVRQFAGVDPEWFQAAPFPALRRWLEGWLASELFAAVMLKFEPWQAGEVEPVF